MPIEWFLDTDMIWHEAVYMDLMPESYINRATFSSHIYNHTSMHVSMMIEDDSKLKTKNTSCLRVLLSSLVKREFEFWDEDELFDFKTKVHNHMLLMKQMEESGIIDFENANYQELKDLQDNNPEIKEVGLKWHEVFENAFTDCNYLIETKRVQHHDSGIWQIIQDHAYRRN